MNKVGYSFRVLPSTRLCCPCFLGTMTPSDSLPAASHFTFWAYRVTPYGFRRAGEGLPSSRHNFHNIPFPIHRRVLPCCVPSSSHVPWSSPNLPRLDSLLSPFGVLFDDAAGFTSCYGLLFCSHSLTGVTLSQGFNLRISPPVACQLRGDLAPTSTGLSPASCA
jgi:hypothetical protein